MPHFWRCFYHVIWSTKNREPVIDVRREHALFGAIRDKSASLNAEIRAVNGVTDHIHVAVCIPPTLAVVDWVKHVKGVSSHAYNAVLPESEARFRWQNGYAVLTFGAKHLPFVVAYIDNQKHHHAQNTLEPYLERLDE
jgi:putative transposase